MFFPGFDYTSYKAIGGKAKSSLQGFSVDKSHVAEMANHNKVVIASLETGVDIRLASTSITNPHCKGQIILRPDTMTLRKLSTHTLHGSSHETEPRTVMSELLTNPDSQSDTQEAIQSERAKGTPLIQTQSTLIHIGDPLRYGR